jgi:hypothetical protein
MTDCKENFIVVINGKLIPFRCELAYNPHRPLLGLLRAALRAHASGPMPHLSAI